MPENETWSLNAPSTKTTWVTNGIVLTVEQGSLKGNGSVDSKHCGFAILFNFTPTLWGR